MLILLIILLLEAGLVARSIRRLGLFCPYPHGNLLLIMVGQASMTACAYGYANYDFADSFSSNFYKSNSGLVNLQFLFFFLMILAPAELASRRAGRAGVGHYGRMIANLRAGPAARSLTPVYAFIGVQWLYFIVLALNLNWSIAWSNSEYMLMNTYGRAVSGGKIPDFLIQILKPMSIFTMSVAGYLAAQRHRLAFLAIAPIAAFYLAYQMGDHTRAAAALVVAFALAHFAVSGSKAVLITGGLMAVYLTNYALFGRSEQAHGIASIPETILVPGGIVWDNSLNTILNIAEGVFTTSEMFVFDVEYGTLYKLLSFSPFPSFIDGFEAIRAQNYVGLSGAATTSAFMESYAFGMAYFAFSIIVQIYIGCAILKKFLINANAFSFIANIMMMIAVYLEFTYPVRNVFRLFILALFFALIARARSASRLQSPRALPGARLSAIPPAVARRRVRLGQAGYSSAVMQDMRPGL